MPKNRKLTEFEKYAPFMGDFDHLEWRSEGLVGKAIRLKTKDFFNHTEAVIINHGEIMAGGADPDVKTRLLENVLKEFKGEAFWYPLKPEYNKYRHELARKFIRYTGTGYDYGNLFRQLWRRVQPNAKEIFCSEALFLTVLFAIEPRPFLIPDKFTQKIKGKFNFIVPRPGSEMGELGLWVDSGYKIL